MSGVVFRSDGIFWSPSPCDWLVELRRRRDALLAALRGELIDTERAQLLENLDQSRIAVNSHIEVCGECQAWLKALETGAGLVKAQPGRRNGRVGGVRSEKWQEVVNRKGRSSQRALLQ